MCLILRAGCWHSGCAWCGCNCLVFLSVFVVLVGVGLGFVFVLGVWLVFGSWVTFGVGVLWIFFVWAFGSLVVVLVSRMRGLFWFLGLGLGLGFCICGIALIHLVVLCIVLFGYVVFDFVVGCVCGV